MCIAQLQLVIHFVTKYIRISYSNFVILCSTIYNSSRVLMWWTILNVVWISSVPLLCNWMTIEFNFTAKSNCIFKCMELNLYKHQHCNTVVGCWNELQDKLWYHIIQATKWKKELHLIQSIAGRKKYVCFFAHSSTYYEDIQVDNCHNKDRVNRHMID